jgi:hypothetical protein
MQFLLFLATVIGIVLFLLLGSILFDVSDDVWGER